MLKKVGTAARLQIEKMVGTKVFLELFVKVALWLARIREFVEELDWRRSWINFVKRIGQSPVVNEKERPCSCEQRLPAIAACNVTVFRPMPRPLLS